VNEKNLPRRTALGALTLGSAAVAVAMTNPAEANSPEEFTRRGAMMIGVVSGVPPFGIVDERGQPAGYDVDVANLIARYMGVRAEITPLAPPARIPALQAGRVDLLVATLGPTPERAKTVLFPMPYNAFRLSIIAPKGLAASALKDLAGRRIAVTRGSPQDNTITRMAMTGAGIVRFDDDATCAQALFSRQVDAAVLADVTITQLLASSSTQDFEQKFSFSLQPNSMAVRLSQTELHRWLNNTIYWIKNTGELDDISRKWLKTPLPELPVF
jgi:polar amino acid transport system substrate-binding protein